MAEITYHESSETVTPAEKLGAILKLVSLFGFLVVIGILLMVRRMWFAPEVKSIVISESLTGLEFKSPYKSTLYENFGFVQEPKITLPLKTVAGYKDTTFLLDSGAVVSTMPIVAANDTGIDLVKAKRITLQGFSGVPIFAYLDKMTLMIGKKEYEFPVTYTESATTTYILGRKGFFDDFSILFDHEQRAIIITKKGS